MSTSEQKDISMKKEAFLNKINEDELDLVLRRNAVDPQFVDLTRKLEIMKLVGEYGDRIAGPLLVLDDPEEQIQLARSEIADILVEKHFLANNPELALTVNGACLIRPDIFQRYNKIKDQTDILSKFGNVIITPREGLLDGGSATEISVDIYNAVIHNVDEAADILDAISEISKRATLGSSFHLAFVEHNQQQIITNRDVETGALPGQVEVVDFGYENEDQGEHRSAQRVYRDMQGDSYSIRREAGAETSFRVIGPYREDSQMADAPVVELEGTNWTKAETEFFGLAQMKLSMGDVSDHAPAF